MNLHDLYEKSNHAAFCFGRLNPPTLGHKQLLDTVARAGQGNYYIFLSQTQKLPDNPLGYEEKVKFVRAMFPEHSKHVITGPGLNTIMRVAAWVYNQGVRSVSFVAGSDRLEDFKALLDKYNGYGEPGQEGYYNFDSINYVSSGERDPDAEGVAGYSASKARAAVMANDFETFKKVTGAGKLAQQLYDAVKAALEAAPVKKPTTKKTKVTKEQGVTETTEYLVAVIDGVRSNRTYNDKDHAHNSLSKLVSYGKAKVAELYINGEKVEHFELNKKYLDFEPKQLDSTMSEAGPFSYGAKKPRKGSVADLAAKKRQEQEKGKQPVEPRDHMVGVARVKKDVEEGFVDDLDDIYALHPGQEESETVAIKIIDVDLDEFDDRWTALPMPYLNEFNGDLPLWDMEDLKMYPYIKVQRMTFDQYVKLVSNYINSDDMVNSVLNKIQRGVAEGNEQNVVVKFSAKEYAAMSPEQKYAKQQEWRQLKQKAKKRLQNFTIVDTDKEQGVAEGLNEFAPDGFNGGDDDEGFSPEIARMAQEDGFSKGVSLADGATLERAITINYWHSQHGGMYRQYFVRGFRAGRREKIRHDNKRYNLNLKLMKDGSIRHSEQGVAENFADGRKFVEPNFDVEWEEAERYPEFVKLGKDAWIKLARKGRAVTINSAQDISNTDAADPDSFKSLVPAKQKRALAQLEKGTVEMPVVAVYSDGHKELVGGNTRLTAMMARDGQATVWAFRVPGQQGVAEGADDIAQAKERLAYLEKIFDTSYEYSDDHSVWRKHNAIRQEMDQLKKLIKQGVNEDKGKSSSNIKDLFAKFLPLAAEYLRLEKLPKINIELTLPDHNGQASFGGYNSNTKEINLAIANRHPVDIFRTLAHELVHYKQDMLGKIKDYSGETGSTEENQANSIAGIIMRLFNKAHPEAMKAEIVRNGTRDIEEDVVDDSVQYHDTLEPTVWEDGVLKPEVRNRLLTIAKKFIDSLNIDNFDAKDIVLTGSMANFNYTKFSDFDLHVVTDYDSLECAKIAEEFYQSKKRIWNRDYDIQINGHDVELYIEDDDDPPVSGGVYSILDNKWIKRPTHQNPEIDLRAVRAKTREYIKKIHDALNGHLDAEAISGLVKKLRDMRTAGLEQAGEFSVENLAYKTLRNAGILDRLSDLRRHQITTDLSL